MAGGSGASLGAMSDEPEVVTVSLISHTNVGKTTLARTLLRRDVGEVEDRAHVTLSNDRFALIEAGGARLDLYDTPGLGDTARLLRRLRGQSNPVGWFLSQVWDRMANRALWSTQQAIRNVREEAEVVLYLVNAAETPEDAGYVGLELDLLAWLERPVLVLLNQMGPPAHIGGAAGTSPEPLETVWRRHTAPWPIVRDVLPLDAFSRCWVQEGELFERILPLLDPARRPILLRCLEAWTARNRTLFHASMDRLAAYLARAAADRESFDAEAWRPGHVRAQAMQRLQGRLEQATRALIDELAATHGLAGRSTHVLAEIFREGAAPGVLRLTPAQGATAAAIVSGAVTGLAADLAVGGLTFGGGALLGAVLGALGGAAFAKGVEVVQGPRETAVTWSATLLNELFRHAVLHYLVVAHYGRGRGPWADRELPAAWAGLVARAAAPCEPRLVPLWRAIASAGAADDKTGPRLAAIVTECATSALSTAYPSAAQVLG